MERVLKPSFGLSVISERVIEAAFQATAARGSRSKNEMPLELLPSRAFRPLSGPIRLLSWPAPVYQPSSPLSSTSSSASGMSMAPSLWFKIEWIQSVCNLASATNVSPPMDLTCG